MECESLVKFSEINIHKARTGMPSVSLFPVTLVQLTMDHILLSFVPYQSTAEKIFYLNNYSEEKLFIKWQRYLLFLNILKLFIQKT